MRRRLGGWNCSGCAKPLRLQSWIRSSAICIGIRPTTLDWCRRRDVHVVQSSSFRPGPRCRIPELVRCTPLPLPLVLRDAPPRVLSPFAKIAGLCCRPFFVNAHSLRHSVSSIRYCCPRFCPQRSILCSLLPASSTQYYWQKYHHAAFVNREGGSHKLWRRGDEVA